MHLRRLWVHLGRLLRRPVRVIACWNGGMELGSGVELFGERAAMLERIEADVALWAEW
jgi:hypothetical protein